MKENEKIFFKMCVRYVETGICAVDIVNILSDFIPPKQSMYYLKKWTRKGFWNYGTSMGRGWFELREMPKIYKDLYTEALNW